MPIERDRDLRTVTRCALYRKTLRPVCANDECGHCYLITEEPPTGNQLAYPPESELKRLLSR